MERNDAQAPNNEMTGRDSMEKLKFRYGDHERNESGIFSKETVVMQYCEASAIAYIFEAGTFRRVVIGD